jgi:hypothetical protein
MARDSSLHVFGGVCIHRSCGIFGKQSNALSESASDRLRKMQDGNGTLVFFDDNFRARFYTRKERGDISRGGFGLGDVNHTLLHNVSIHPCAAA